VSGLLCGVVLAQDRELERLLVSERGLEVGPLELGERTHAGDAGRGFGHHTPFVF
jgi:hypothetical protein